MNIKNFKACLCADGKTIATPQGAYVHRNGKFEKEIIGNQISHAVILDVVFNFDNTVLVCKKCRKPMTSVFLLRYPEEKKHLDTSVYYCDCSKGEVETIRIPKSEL